MDLKSIHGKWLLFAIFILIRNKPRPKGKWLLGLQMIGLLIENAVSGS